MESNPRIGTASGKPYYRIGTNRLISERCGDEMSVGMIKFYRTICLKQIGGFISQVMWDGIDCHRCRMLGWIACSWDAPELRFLHLRPMGSSQKNILAGRQRHGAGQYFMGTSLAYMTTSALWRITSRPYLFGGLAMWWGYVRAMFNDDPRYQDRRFRQFLRRYQRRCLLLGKRRASAVIHKKGRLVWSRQATANEILNSDSTPPFPQTRA